MREKCWAVQRMLQIRCMCLFSVMCVTVTHEYTLNTCYAHGMYFVHVPWVFIKCWNNGREWKMRFSLPLVSCYTGRIPTQTRSGPGAAFASLGEDLFFWQKEARCWTVALSFSLSSGVFVPVRSQSFSEQDLAFCHLGFVPPQQPLPHLSCCCVSEPPKKIKRLDSCFPGVSVPPLT